MGEYQGGYLPGPVARRPVGYIVVVVLFAVLGGLVDALFSFGMLFATDSCGTGGAGGSAPVCTPAVWLLAVALPWAGLVALVLVASLGAVWARRRGRSAWLALPAALGAYLLACALSYLLVFVL
ncbi:hypothetical protein [Kitasatospora sp. NPDC048407]|uniref:hypothetical protein n=1 Tax=Kitasatospora sp. NPDC048407 TaxID=3364051 RepID=UPI00371980A5